MNSSQRNMVVMWIVISATLLGTCYLLQQLPFSTNHPNQNSQSVDLGVY